MKFRITNEVVKANCLKEISLLPHNAYEVDIREAKRSNHQNALYWKWIEIIGNALGYEKDDMHEAFKRQFLGTDQGKDIFGNIYLKPKASSKLKKREFSEYMNKIQAFAHAENIVLPQPDYYGY